MPIVTVQTPAGALSDTQKAELIRKVTDVVVFGTTTEAELLAVASGVETGSSHPLAIAILNKAKDAGVTALPSRDAKALMGKGVIATVGDASAWVASPRYAMENGGLDGLGLRQATVFEEEGKTAVAVFREKTPLGLIAMRDEPRNDAKESVRQLTAMGVTSIILTGDNPRTAAAIAGSLGMEFQADMMPEDKLKAIKGNSGLGHSFEAPADADKKTYPNGVIGRKLSDDERYDLIEYLKTL